MSIEKHAGDYTKGGNAHQDYTDDELRQWVHLLRKRAGMRTDMTKATKDRYDADNYEQMLKDRGASL